MHASFPVSQEMRLTEGIVLRTVPFQDFHHIATLFTPEAGMITLIDKGRRCRSKPWMPLTKVEVVYRESRGGIFNCREAALIDAFAELRKELVWLEAGCDLLQALLSSQMVGKPSPNLYALLCCYLEKIPSTSDPWLLPTSFRLKLLRHDGWVALPFRCGGCGEVLQSTAYSRNAESWCPLHRPDGSQEWTQEELACLYRLGLCQTYRELGRTTLPAPLREKFVHWFAECLN